MPLIFSGSYGTHTSFCTRNAREALQSLLTVKSDCCQESHDMYWIVRCSCHTSLPKKADTKRAGWDAPSNSEAVRYNQVISWEHIASGGNALGKKKCRLTPHNSVNLVDYFDYQVRLFKANQNRTTLGTESLSTGLHATSKRGQTVSATGSGNYSPRFSAIETGEGWRRHNSFVCS